MNAQIKISRIYKESRSLVYNAWTKAEYLSAWFAPEPLTSPECNLDFKEGGSWKLTLEAPDGSRHLMDAVYTEIISQEVIAFTTQISNQPQGGEVLTTVTFSDISGGTRVYIHQVYKCEIDTSGAEEGWSSTLKNLSDFLKK